jgi:hypothetical protein
MDFFGLSTEVAALPYIHNFETFDFVSQLFLELFMAPEPYASLVSKLYLSTTWLSLRSFNLRNCFVLPNFHMLVYQIQFDFTCQQL